MKYPQALVVDICLARIKPSNIAFVSLNKLADIYCRKQGFGAGLVCGVRMVSAISWSGYQGLCTCGEFGRGARFDSAAEEGGLRGVIEAQNGRMSYELRSLPPSHIERSIPLESDAV